MQHFIEVLTWICIYGYWLHKANWYDKIRNHYRWRFNKPYYVQLIFLLSDGYLIKTDGHFKPSICQNNKASIKLTLFYAWACQRNIYFLQLWPRRTRTCRLINTDPSWDVKAASAHKLEACRCLHSLTSCQWGWLRKTSRAWDTQKDPHVKPLKVSVSFSIFSC